MPPTKHFRFTVQKFENYTARTELRSNAQGQLSVSLEEVEKEKLTLVIPKRTLAAGHNVGIILEAKVHQKTYSLEISGRVSLCEDISKDQDRITVTMSQYDLKDWEEILEALEEEQKRVLNIMKNIKGY